MIFGSACERSGPIIQPESGSFKEPLFRLRFETASPKSCRWCRSAARVDVVTHTADACAGERFVLCRLHAADPAGATALQLLCRRLDQYSRWDDRLMGRGPPHGSCRRLPLERCTLLRPLRPGGHRGGSASCRASSCSPASPICSQEDEEGMSMAHPLSHEGLRYGGKTGCDCGGLLGV
jgi:hypothetical protein